jgi:hypothetical protein
MEEFGFNSKPRSQFVYELLHDGEGLGLLKPLVVFLYNVFHPRDSL